MSGLEKIVDRISKESEGKAAAILEDARAKAAAVRIAAVERIPPR